MDGRIENEIVDIQGSLSLVLRGQDGLSAYEVAVKNGFVGTEAQWLESLKGESARAEAYTHEAEEYWHNAQASAIQAGNSAVEAATYKNEAQGIREAIFSDVADARAAILAEKEEAEEKKLLVDDAAANAHLDREQADADAAEVRYLYNETITQKNVATDAAERARYYSERHFRYDELLDRPTTRDGFGITDVPLVDGTDATGTWDINVTGTVNGHTVKSDVPEDAVFTDTTYEAMTAVEAETGTETTSRVITAKVLADYVAGTVSTAVTNLVNSSPAALDTLKELADALGNDPNFATTVMNAIGQKLDKAGGVVTGDLAVNGTLTADVTGNADTATKLATARTIDGVSFNGTANITHYGSCSTAAATAAKTVACTGFTLATGARIEVKFTVTNTAANPTLNVNSTGAKAIYYRGAAIPAGYLAADRTYAFIYNGTQYELVGDLNTDVPQFVVSATAPTGSVLWIKPSA